MHEHENYPFAIRYIHCCTRRRGTGPPPHSIVHPNSNPIQKFSEQRAPLLFPPPPPSKTQINIAKSRRGEERERTSPTSIPQIAWRDDHGTSTPSILDFSSTVSSSPSPSIISGEVRETGCLTRLRRRIARQVSLGRWVVWRGWGKRVWDWNPVGLEGVIGGRGELTAEDLNPPGGGGRLGAGASRLDELARRRETAADPAARGRGHGEQPLIPLHRSRNS